ncbi:homocysteine-responsive endoplasmic reticulum-resident ubiquitin-like domain member 2 protein [Styela clava]
MDTSAFTIVVRTPNSKDMSIQLNSSSTIHELKRKIQCDHPGSPKIDRQRLIYNGRMLIDHHKIDTVIKESNTVIHLVYSVDETNKISTSTELPSPPPPEIRQRIHSNPVENQATHPYHGNTHQTHHAYAAWMQHYHQQYNYYMQFYAGQNHPMHARPAQDPGTLPDVNPDNAQPQVAAPAQEPAEIRDAQGRPMIADDDNGQDWLDVMFAFTRFGLMLSIIYFYSSTYRFIIAVSLLLVIYLYQAGVFRVNRRPRVPQNADPNNAEQQQRDDNNNNSGESGDDEQNTSEQDNTPPPPPSIFATAFCFIRSFFSSLVPTEAPGVVN